MGKKVFPIGAAGLAGAALAGVWENHKKNKAEKEINLGDRAPRGRSRSRSRSRSQSRSRSVYGAEGPPNPAYGNKQGLLEYGYGAGPTGADQFGRPRSSESYEPAPAHYNRRSVSSDGSFDHEVAPGIAGAGAASRCDGS